LIELARKENQREELQLLESLSNHIGAIKYFICHYNQVLAPSITFS